MSQWIGWALLGVVVLYGTLPASGRWFALLERLFGRLSRRADLAIVGVGVVSLAITAGLSLITTAAVPQVCDEFSYLLAADTFAHGRLTNPPHPMARHFQTLQVLQQPTYASKYPPAQGLLLAGGMVLAGDPIVAVWLSTALACAAVCWMLYAWFPPRWALLGSLLLTTHGVMLVWSQSYWGGAMAVGGAALVLGAARRLMNKGGSPGYSVLLGVGLVILANSRPYEGMVLALPVGVVLAIWLIGSTRLNPAIWLRVAAPLLVVLGIGAAAMCYYNWRVTGRALLLPYSLHSRIYSRTPHFVWGQVGPRKQYENPQMDEFHNYHEPLDWLHQHAVEMFNDRETRMSFAEAKNPPAVALSIGSFGQECGIRLWRIMEMTFEAKFPLFVLLPMLYLAIRRDRWMRLALLMVGISVCGLMLVTWNLQSRYIAPAAPVWLIVLLGCLRELHCLRVAEVPIARGVATAVVLLSMVSGVLGGWQAGGGHTSSSGMQRQQTVSALLQKPGNHLVLVRYGSEHQVIEEWVYNGADIDNSRVIFAHELGGEKDRPLLEYYKGRKVWRVLVDGPRPPEVAQFR